jgi:dipeptidyl aminopeptidase/acylaminoacyl peptidase
MKISGYLVLSLAALSWSASASAQQAKRAFTLADDIGLTLFATQGGGDPAVHFSPDGKYFAVWTERGSVAHNRVEDSLRFYRTQDVEAFLKGEHVQPPKPVWVVALADKRNPVIDQWRWLGDSSGVAFLKPGPDGVILSQQLVVADLKKRTVEPLMPTAAEVQGFDIRDRQHFVYVTANHADWEKRTRLESESSAVVGTGRSLYDLMFPRTPFARHYSPSTKQLSAVMDGKRFEVTHNGLPLDFDEHSIALSPDGKSLAALAPVEEVPASWEKLYLPPPFLGYGGGGSFRPGHTIQAGHRTAKQYVRIDLKSGRVQPFVDAPSMDSVGIMSGMYVAPWWSADGRAVLLPGAFLQPKPDEPARPCIAIIDLQSNSSSCVVTPKEGYSEDKSPVDNFHRHIDVILDARFAPRDNRQVLVTVDSYNGAPGRRDQYQQNPDHGWQYAGETIGSIETGPNDLQIKVMETFKEPPLLVAARKETSRVLWDPNPQLHNIQLADVSVYKWKDSEGRNWSGALYKPANYQPGRRYPLVVQTHGFDETAFAPSGLYTTAFAAQEQAAAGIMVLQLSMIEDRDCEMGTPNEAPCDVGVYTSAIKQLVSDGSVDPERVGIIGFSRTCYYVMEMLTTNPIRLRAASITDGILIDYFSCMFSGSCDGETTIVGTKPYGEGLQQWLKRSPEFKLDQVRTPLLVNTVINAPEFTSVFSMWAPYIGLRNLNKPVELMLFNGTEHIATNPAVRMGSQGGSVDWFRFWLQDYEDPDPAKAEQYERWRELKKLQAEHDKKALAGNVGVPLSTDN